MDEVILPLIKEGDLAVPVLAWCTLLMKQHQDVAISAYNTKYHRYIFTAFQQNVFHQMYLITQCENLMVLKSLALNNMSISKILILFQNCEAGPLIKIALFTLLAEACDKFNTNNEVYHSKDSCHLLSELLTHPKVATKCLKDVDVGASSLYNTAIKTFPYDFISITYLYSTLTLFPHYKSQVL